jgi:membrane-bound inhibitor of C-type lysozyme
MTQGRFVRHAESARQPKARIFLAGLLTMLAAPVGEVAPAFAQTFLTFRCADGTEFVTVLRQGTRNAYVQLDGKAITLPRRLSLSGARYSADRTALRIKQTPPL